MNTALLVTSHLQSPQRYVELKMWHLCETTISLLFLLMSTKSIFIFFQVIFVTNLFTQHIYCSLKDYFYPCFYKWGNGRSESELSQGDYCYVAQLGLQTSSAPYYSPTPFSFPSCFPFFISTHSVVSTYKSSNLKTDFGLIDVFVFFYFHFHWHLF